MSHKLTAEQAREIFYYNHDDGSLYWKVDRYARKVKGLKAGWVSSGKDHKTSYINVRLDGKIYKAHRLIWLINYGEWPQYIDHIDGDGTNNRISNIRSVSIPENMKNRPRQSNNSSGVTGVSFLKRLKKWKSSISVNKEKICLGYFFDFNDAVKARKQAEAKYGYHENHGR